jgi:antitoxin Phd
MKNWRLADAKNKLDELVTLAIIEGPQVIRGRQGTVITVAEHEYKCLVNKKLSFKEYLVQGPSFEGLDLSRKTRSVPY